MFSKPTMQLHGGYLLVFFCFLSCVSFTQVTTTFNFTGATQTYTVPPCVTSIQYAIHGAQGGGAAGGNGATVTGTLTVTPGQVLQIRVGGQGTVSAGGYNGGGNGVGSGNASAGGGGASDIRESPYDLTKRIVVAAGGGGDGGGNPTNPAGGAGGCATGVNGTNGYGQAGTGGSQVTGGIGGTAWSASGSNGQNGALGVGGNGGADNCASASHGGGGGGGFYGGGGGGPDCYGGGAPYSGGGGGGGSSLTPAGGACVAGNNAGNGIVTITIPSAPTTTITSTSESVCHGTNFTVSGTVTAIGAWTITLSNGQTTTGTGNGTWNIVVSPTNSTTYTVTNITDAIRCTVNPSGSVTVTLPLTGTSLSLDSESATCLVNQNGWIHFYHTSGRLIASVNSLGQNLGNVTMTSYLDGTNQVMPACTAPLNPNHFTAVMQRHWVISPTNQPTTPVQVRLPFQNVELTTLTTTAGANSNINDNVVGIGNLKLSKYSGPANVDNNASNNCPAAGGNAGTTLHTQSANGVTTAYSAVTGASYSDHSISSFSEFWLHGSFNNSPLPVVLESFTVNCDNQMTVLNWTTSSEQNSDYFEVERSENGLDWEIIAKIDAFGNSSQTINYAHSDSDRLIGKLVYYRLVLVNLDNGRETFTPLSSNCSKDNRPFYIHPNPSNDRVKVVLSRKGTAIIFRDMKGRIIKNIPLSPAGNQLIEVSVSELSSGSYLVEFQMKNGLKEILRFNKN